VVNGLVEFLNYFYRGLARSDIESTLSIAQRGGLLLCAALVLWRHPTVIGLAVAMLTPVVATLVYSLYRSRTLAVNVALIAGAPPSTLDVRVELLRDVWPIGAGIVLSALYFRIDVLLLAWWSGTAAVATYNAMFRLVEALRLLPAAVLAVALPALCRSDSLRPLVRLAASMTIVAVVIAGGLWLVAPRLIPLLYGDGYAAGVPAFQILLFSFPLMTLNYALTTQLVGWHRHYAYAVVCGVALVVNVALNVVLLPALGMAGAAWATVAAEIVVSVGAMAALGQPARLSSLAGARLGPRPLHPLNPADVN
jgi:O-antigen/teichoic acid export membrane protein